MSFAALRSLYAVIGDALDDMERVYADAGNASYAPDSPRRAGKESHKETSASGLASPPPSPSVPPSGSSSPPWLNQPLDFPSLDQPYDPISPSEALVSHPTVITSINRLVAAAGQMSAMTQTPFLSLCDASMGYQLPSCLRLLEASHTVELLREAGPEGLHVSTISIKTGVNQHKMAHILRLLATHHILREVSPDVFTNNRISSLIDSGKPFLDVVTRPEAKYRDTNGIAAFVGMCTDELFKASSYLTEAYLLSPDASTERVEPTRAPFNYAFNCMGVGFFPWLEGEGVLEDLVNTCGRGCERKSNPNQFRLERFGKAMSGTEGWEVPGAILSGFDWHSLRPGSTVVDVGGGIGSTCMLLAGAFSSHNDAESLRLKFVIQDRDVVVKLGEDAWQAKCPEYLESGIARFEVHDFLSVQPIRDAAVFLLRVILHDWPDAYARKILLLLREASTPETRLLIADFVLPLACADDPNAADADDLLNGVEGADAALACPPLLANLGKANANGYWMDMTMQCTFNSQERTLREIATLCRSAGWKITKVVKAPGSLFGHITAVPAALPNPLPSPTTAYRAKKTSANLHVLDDVTNTVDSQPFPSMYTRSATPTFGTNVDLMSYEETKARGSIKLGTLRGIGKKAVGRLRRMTISKEKEKIGPSPLGAAIELDSKGTKAPSASKRQSSLSLLPPIRPSVQLDGVSLSETSSLYPQGSSPRSPRRRESPLRNATSMANISPSSKRCDDATSNSPITSFPGESTLSLATSPSQRSPYVPSDGSDSPQTSSSPRRRRRRGDNLVVGLGNSFIRSLSFGTGGVISVERAAEVDPGPRERYPAEGSPSSISFSSLGSAFHISSSSSRDSERSNDPPSPVSSRSPQATSGLRYATSMLDLSADPFSRENSTVADSTATGGTGANPVPSHQRQASLASEIAATSASFTSLPVPSPKRKRGDTIVGIGNNFMKTLRGGDVGDAS